MEVLNVVAVINDVDKICRTCLAEKEKVDLHSLYDKTLDEMVWELVRFMKPISGDGLPTHICTKCVTQLNVSLAFKEQCQKSEVRLRHILLIATPEKSDITLKELLSTNFDTGVKSDRFEKNLEDAAIQTDVNVSKKRRKRKAQDWSIPYHSSEDELVNDEDSELLLTHNTTSVEAEIECEESKFKCHKCQKAFRSATGLRVHLVKHGKKIQCEVCAKQFGLVKHLNTHMKLHKDYKPHVCKTCKKPFAAAGNLTKHMRVHGGEKKYLCITCGRRFFEPGHLAVHMRTHTGEKPIICNVCGKRFADPHGLVAHNKTHTGERNYECKTCGKRFAHSFVLTAHIRIHTGEKPYQCAICGASYATSSYLTIHKRTHTQEKPFNCETCPKAFVSRCALVAHCMTHTGEKRFQCNVCGKRVARAADLNIHMRSHTGERPYSCNQCPKRYHTSSNLSAHKRTHLGIKNHICSVCDKAFGDARTLKCHTRIHTGEKPYVCHICGNRYSQSGQLAAHRKIHLNQSVNRMTKKNQKHTIKINSVEVQELSNDLTHTNNIQNNAQVRTSLPLLVHVYNAPEEVPNQNVGQLTPVLQLHTMEASSFYSNFKTVDTLQLNNESRLGEGSGEEIESNLQQTHHELISSCIKESSANEFVE